MDNRYRLLIKDTLIFALGSLGSKLILFFLVPLYTNYLTAAEYGIADLVTTVSQLLIPISSLVINNAVIRFGMMRGEKPEDVLTTSFTVLGISSLVVGISFPLLGLYKPIAQWRAYLALQVVLANISEVERTYLKVKGKNKAFSLISILQTTVLACMNIVLLTIYNEGVSGYLVSNIAATASATIAAFFAGGVSSDLRRGKLDYCLLKRMIAYSAPLILSNVSWWVVNSSDKIMIEWLLSASVLGVYTAASKIPSLINVIIAIFNQAWGISTIREVESSDETVFYSNVFALFSTLLFGACLLFVALLKPFMEVYVGQAFVDAWKYASFLLVAAVFYSVSAFIGSLYSAFQKTANDMWTTILCAAVNLGVNYVAIPYIGLWGAVLGTLAAYFTCATVRLVDISRFVSLGGKGGYFANGVLATVQAAAVSFEWHPILVSVITMLAFLGINRQQLVMLLRKVFQTLRRLS